MIGVSGFLARGFAFGVSPLAVSWGLGPFGQGLPAVTEVLPLKLKTTEDDGLELEMADLTPFSISDDAIPRMTMTEAFGPRVASVELAFRVKGTEVQFCAKIESSELSANVEKKNPILNKDSRESLFSTVGRRVSLKTKTTETKVGTSSRSKGLVASSGSEKKPRRRKK